MLVLLALQPAVCDCGRRYHLEHQFSPECPGVALLALAQLTPDRVGALRVGKLRRPLLQSDSARGHTQPRTATTLRWP